MGIKFRAILLVTIAVVMVASMVGTTYAWSFNSSKYCFPPPHPGPRYDLKIRDQDEYWGDGVTATWVAENMKPGDSYAFEGSFVGLKSNRNGSISLGCDYIVEEDSPNAEPDYDPHTDLVPDDMARELIITGAYYQFGCWGIDLLEGRYYTISWRQTRYNLGWPVAAWRIRDVDGDGRITFYDLKHHPPSNLPLSNGFFLSDAVFKMSVKFAETAGNNLQGDTFILTMSYSFRP